MTTMLRWTEDQLAAYQRRSEPRRRAQSAREPSAATRVAQTPRESLLRDLLVAAGLPEPYREFTWHPTRNWRLDLAWPDQRLAVEIDGAVHRIRDKFARDIERHNALTLDGWRYLRLTPEQVSSGEAIVLVRKLLA